MNKAIYLLFLFYYFTKAQYPYINEVHISPTSCLQVDSENFIEISIPPTELATFSTRYALLFIENDPNRVTDYIEIDQLKKNSRQTNNAELFVMANGMSVPNTAVYLQGRWKVPDDLQAILLIQKPISTELKSGLESLTSGLQSVITDPPVLTTEQILLLQPLIVDAIVISSDLSTQAWFQIVKPDWVGFPKKIPLGDDLILDEFSLNRCNTNLRFRSANFWYGAPTPGKVNSCIPDAAEFSNSYTVQAHLHTETNPPDCLNYETSVVKHLDRIKQRHVISKPLEEWFRDEKSTARSFFTYVEKEDVQESGIRCEICYSMRKGVPGELRISSRESLTKEPGAKFSNTDDHAMLRFIRKHLKASEHVKVAEKVTKGCRDETDPSIEPTANKIGLVYLETLLGYSLNSHEGLTKGLNHLGYNVGQNYNSRRSATRINQFISKEMHEEMITYMMKTNTFFSLLLDSSTDISGLHGMLLFFMYIENGNVVTKMWHYVESKDSTALGMEQSIERLVANDETILPGFSNYFKRQLAAVATDGASNMRGQYNSVVVKLKDYITPNSDRGNRPLQSYHCANHKLALAYNDVIYAKDEHLKFCETLSQHINRLGSFYATRSYKRRMEFKEQADEVDIPVRQFRKILKVHWVPAMHEAYSVVDNNFEVLVSHLNKILNSPRVQPPLYTPENEI